MPTAQSSQIEASSQNKNDCCPKCGSENCKKDGKNKKSIQKFKCKDCKKIFTQKAKEKLMTFDDLVHFGCDIIRFRCTPITYAENNYWSKEWFKIWQLYETLDYDNGSNCVIHFFDWKLNVQKVHTPLGQALHFSHDNFRMFQILKTDPKSVISKGQVWYDILIDGSFFAMSTSEMFDVDYQFLENFIPLQNKSVNRLDICFDIPNVTPDQVHELVSSTLLKDTWMRSDKKIETAYFGNPAGSNKRHLIRIYDKKNESLKKKRLDLYMHFCEYDEITRLEIEMRTSGCKVFQIKFEDIFDKVKLQHIAATYFRTTKTTFKFDFGSINNLPRYYKPTKEATWKFFQPRVQNVCMQAMRLGDYKLWDIIQMIDKETTADDMIEQIILAFGIEHFESSLTRILIKHSCAKKNIPLDDIPFLLDS